MFTTETYGPEFALNVDRITATFAKQLARAPKALHVWPHLFHFFQMCIFERIGKLFIKL